MKDKTKDQIFSKKRDSIEGFQFNQEVARVFDDMVQRSVPIYHEIHKILSDVYLRFIPHKEGNLIYDLGCSTGETLLSLIASLSRNSLPIPQFIGIDNSQAMLEQCQKKLEQLPQFDRITLQCKNIEEVEFSPAQMIVMNYTLQFIPLEKRIEILKRIHQALCPRGIFLLSEKIKSPDHVIEGMITTLYYDFKKRNGYSELEIAQKREALENVLMPLTPEEQLEQFRQAGFKKFDVLFRWYNFACYIGIKE